MNRRDLIAAALACATPKPKAQGLTQDDVARIIKATREVLEEFEIVYDPHPRRLA